MSRRQHKQPWEYSTNKNTVRARERKARLSSHDRTLEQAKASDSKAITRAWKIRAQTDAYKSANKEQQMMILKAVEDQVRANRSRKEIDADSKILRFMQKQSQSGSPTLPTDTAITATSDNVDVNVNAEAYSEADEGYDSDDNSAASTAHTGAFGDGNADASFFLGALGHVPPAGAHTKGFCAAPSSQAPAGFPYLFDDHFSGRNSNSEGIGIGDFDLDNQVVLSPLVTLSPDLPFNIDREIMGFAPTQPSQAQQSYRNYGSALISPTAQTGDGLSAAGTTKGVLNEKVIDNIARMRLHFATIKESISDIQSRVAIFEDLLKKLEDTVFSSGEDGAHQQGVHSDTSATLGVISETANQPAPQNLLGFERSENGMGEN